MGTLSKTKVCCFFFCLKRKITENVEAYFSIFVGRQECDIEVRIVLYHVSNWVSGNLTPLANEYNRKSKRIIFAQAKKFILSIYVFAMLHISFARQRHFSSMYLYESAIVFLH